MSEPFSIDVDHQARIVTIEGIRYAFDLFTNLGIGPVGAIFQIVSRDDGVVALETLTYPRPGVPVCHADSPGNFVDTA